MNHENEQDEGHEQDDAENQNSSNSSGKICYSIWIDSLLDRFTLLIQTYISIYISSKQRQIIILKFKKEAVRRKSPTYLSS